MGKVRAGRPAYETLRAFWHGNDCTHAKWCQLLLFYIYGRLQRHSKAFESNSKCNFSKNCELWNHDFINHKANALSSLQHNFIESNANWFPSQILSLCRSSPWQQLTIYGWGQISAAVSALSSINGCFWWEGREPLHMVGMRPCPHSSPELLSAM